MRLLLTDVDGCWTDGSVLVHADGSASTTFHVHDGYGLVLVQRAGVEVVVISGRDNPAARTRAEHLGIRELRMGSFEKGALADEILAARALEPSQIAAFGDDLPDLELYSRVGVRLAPANAVAELRAAADYVTQAPGGHGALREVCELLMAARAATQRP